jgi:hypothetical protein
MNVFPFTLPRDVGDRLFISYLNSDQRAEATRSSFWRWLSVNVTVHSPTRLQFQTFGAAGVPQDDLYVDVRAEVLADHIALRKLQVAEMLLEQRELEAARLARAKAIDAIHLELFGDLPGDAS